MLAPLVLTCPTCQDHVMGLKNWMHNKRMTDPVSGSFQLTSCSGNSGGASYENCHMSGVVVGPGIEPTAVEHYCTAPTKRWPVPGETLPVTVDRHDPSRLHIDWHQVPTGRDLGRQLAQDLAASMGGVQVPQTQGAPVDTTATHEVLGAPGRAMPGVAGGGLTPGAAAAAAANPSMQAATARVIAVHDIAVPPGMLGGGGAGTVDLTLDVALPSGEGWVATMRIGFSTAEKRARVATVGLTLPVLVNAQAHDQIAVDTARLGLPS